MLCVIEPSELQHFLAIEELARAERREAAEEVLQRLCEEIAPVAGAMPIVYIREGRQRDELLALIAEEPTISILVLAAGTGPEGPGPLVSSLVGASSRPAASGSDVDAASVSASFLSSTSQMPTERA